MQDLFDLSFFSGKDLWKQDSFLWEPLQALQGFFQKRAFPSINPQDYPGVFFQDPERIFVEGPVKIEPGSFLQGPCFLGKNSEIRHGAYLRGPVFLGKECVVGHCSEVKHSILLNKARVAHFNYVGDSIIGNEVILGAGVICANFRIDQDYVCVFEEGGEKAKTPCKKLGAFVGDHSFIGCNSVLNPGTVLPKNSKIAPLSSVRGSAIFARKGHEVL